MDNNQWLKHYRTNKSAVWIKAKLTDGQEFFFETHHGWKGIKSVCDAKKIFFSELCLQFRSHEVKIDVEDAEGVYLVRSILGQVGADCKHYYTVGVLEDKEMHKKMWLIPELVPEKEHVDDISDCFEEAIIYNEKKKKN